MILRLSPVGKYFRKEYIYDLKDYMYIMFEHLVKSKKVVKLDLLKDSFLELNPSLEWNLPNLLEVLVKGMLVKEGLALVHPYRWDTLMPELGTEGLILSTNKESGYTPEEFVSLPNFDHYRFKPFMPAFRKNTLRSISRRYCNAKDYSSVLESYNETIYNYMCKRSYDDHFFLAYGVEEGSYEKEMIKKLGTTYDIHNYHKTLSRCFPITKKQLRGILIESGIFKNNKGEFTIIGSSLKKVKANGRICFRVHSFDKWVRTLLRKGEQKHYGVNGFKGIRKQECYERYKKYWKAQEELYSGKNFSYVRENLAVVRPRWHDKEGRLLSWKVVKGR